MAEREAQKLAHTLTRIFSQHLRLNKRDIKKDGKDRVQCDRLDQMYSSDDTEDSISTPPESCITGEIQAEGGDPSRVSSDESSDDG